MILNSVEEIFSHDIGISGDADLPSGQGGKMKKN